VKAKFGNVCGFYGTTIEGNETGVRFLNGSIMNVFSFDNVYFEMNTVADVVADDDYIKFTKFTNCFFTYGGTDVNKKYIYSKGLWGTTFSDCTFAYPAVTNGFKHIDAPVDVTSVTDYLRETAITNNRCGNGSSPSIAQPYLDFIINATEFNSNNIENGVYHYSNRYSYGYNQYGKNPFFSHPDGGGSANKSELVFNTDGTISHKYWRNYSYMGEKKGLSIIGATTPSYADLTLSNGWVNKGTPFANAGYTKDAAGRVHLKGVVSGGTTTVATVMFTLPTGYTPTHEMRIPVVSADAFGYIRILTNGQVLFVIGSNSWLSLDGVSFPTI
jgi:hypothetical protein